MSTEEGLSERSEGFERNLSAADGTRYRGPPQSEGVAVGLYGMDQLAAYLAEQRIVDEMYLALEEGRMFWSDYWLDPYRVGDSD